MKKQAYFSRQANRFTEEELAWCRTYTRENWPKETAHILRIAEEVSENTFLFDLPWDMERTFEPVSYGEKIDWEKIPFEDPEYVYQLCRHRYLICLGQAYQLTGKERYAESFVRILTDWFDNEPLTEERKGLTWRTIEAGIRAESWTKAILYFENSPAITDAFMERFTEALELHGEYLINAYVPFKISSNWGVLENRGLYLIGSALGKETYQETALKRLEEEASVQIMRDGVHWEQSPMYHNEVLHCFLETARQIRDEGKELPKFLEKVIRNMSLANLAWKKPNHCQFAAGDSDETDLRDQLTHSAFLLGDGLLKFGGYEKLDFEGAWDYRKKGQEFYEGIPVKEPEQTDWMLKESGNYYLRSGWEETADLLHFRCGPLGGGHGHFDKLHVDLVLDGEDVLIDGGRYQYVFHDKRIRLKNAAGHNTVLVDGEEAAELLNSWVSVGAMPEIRMEVISENGYTLIQGAHLGYLKEGGNVYCQRKVLRLKDGLYLIADSFYGGSAHTYQQFFHFAPQGTLSKEGSRFLFKGKQTEAVFLFPGEDLQIEMVDSICSMYYNEYRENKALTVEKAGRSFCTMYAVIAKGAFAKNVEAKKVPVYSLLQGKPLSETDAEGIWIQAGEKEYTVFFRNRDLSNPCDLIGNEKQYGLGRTMVFAEDEEGTILEW